MPEITRGSGAGDASARREAAVHQAAATVIARTPASAREPRRYAVPSCRAIVGTHMVSTPILRHPGQRGHRFTGPWDEGPLAGAPDRHTEAVRRGGGQRLSQRPRRPAATIDQRRSAFRRGYATPPRTAPPLARPVEPEVSPIRQTSRAPGTDGQAPPVEGGTNRGGHAAASITGRLGHHGVGLDVLEGGGELGRRRVPVDRQRSAAHPDGQRRRDRTPGVVGHRQDRAGQPPSRSAWRGSSRAECRPESSITATASDLSARRRNSHHCSHRGSPPALGRHRPESLPQVRRRC